MENKRKNIYIIIFAITTIIASCLAIYFAIDAKETKKEEISQIVDNKENNIEKNEVTENKVNESQTNINSIEDKKNEETKEDKKLDLSIQGEFVQNLYSKIVMNEADLRHAYSSAKIRQADISAVDKAKFVLQKMRMNNDFEVVYDTDIITKMKHYINPSYVLEKVDKYSLEKVISMYTNFYGSASDFPYDYIKSIAYVFEYDKEDKCFYGHTFVGGGGSIPYATVLYNAEKNGDEICLYDYYAEAWQQNDGNYAICGSIQSDTLTTVDYTQIEKEDLERFAKKYKITHKHTFKYNADIDDYYWFSSERVASN